MADKTEIEFTIGPDGDVSFEVKGVKGPDCQDLTRGLEEELGVVTARRKTAEYYEEVSEEDSVSVGEDADSR